MANKSNSVSYQWNALLIYRHSFYNKTLTSYKYYFKLITLINIILYHVQFNLKQFNLTFKYKDTVKIAFIAIFTLFVNTLPLKIMKYLVTVCYLKAHKINNKNSEWITLNPLKALVLFLHS